jgi:large subunit ribosomal protein L24
MAHQPAPRQTKTPEIRKGDTVVVLSGKDAGKRGTVEHVIHDRQSFRTRKAKYAGGSGRDSAVSTVSVVVEGLNIAKRHTKARQRSTGGAIGSMPKVDPGGIIDLPQPMSISKVMLVCSHCGKPTRVAHKTLENGRRVRVCRHCNEQLEVKTS